MRRLTFGFINKLVANIDHFDPAPFPGRHPIRWSIRFRDINDKSIFRYVGKPNLHIAKHTIKLMREKEGRVYIKEFDRKHIINEQSSYTPCSLRSTFNHTSLQHRYRPYTPNEPLGWLLMARKIHATVDQKLYPIWYSNQIDTSNLADWKLWLKTTPKTAPSKSTSTKAKKAPAVDWTSTPRTTGT
jgi:hypothetical protein